MAANDMLEMLMQQGLQAMMQSQQPRQMSPLDFLGGIGNQMQGAMGQIGAGMQANANRVSANRQMQAMLDAQRAGYQSQENIAGMQDAGQTQRQMNELGATTGVPWDPNKTPAQNIRDGATRGGALGGSNTTQENLARMQQQGQLAGFQSNENIARMIQEGQTQRLAQLSPLLSGLFGGVGGIGGGAGGFGGLTTNYGAGVTPHINSGVQAGPVLGTDATMALKSGIMDHGMKSAANNQVTQQGGAPGSDLRRLMDDSLRSSLGQAQHGFDRDSTLANTKHMLNSQIARARSGVGFGQHAAARTGRNLRANQFNKDLAADMLSPALSLI